ncbi:hypothetical protein Rruber_01228 [Rhodococcus ruber]
MSSASPPRWVLELVAELERLEVPDTATGVAAQAALHAVALSVVATDALRGHRIEPVVQDGPQSQHDPCCREGWLGEDSDGRMVPCLLCKPHLRRGEVGMR